MKEKLNHKIFHDEINIIDNPMIVRGLSSKPFDDEGCSMSELSLVKNGVLKNWLLDTATSKQLSMTSNSRASRGVSSPPTPSHTNLFIDNGNKSTEQILSEVNNGFYVTDLIGQGVNLITGDYSRGASGFKIENGKKINSQKLKLPSGKTLKGDERKQFELDRIKIDLKLAELR